MKVGTGSLICFLLTVMCLRLTTVAQTPSPPPASPRSSPVILPPSVSIPGRRGSIFDLLRRPKALRNLWLTVNRHPGERENYEEGGPLPVRCVFENRGHSALKFLLADHHDYHGTLPYPVGMRVRVKDSNGQMLTYTEDFGEWWTQYYVWSTTFEEMSGDWVKLKPNQQIMRVVPLDKMLMGLKGLYGGLKAGEYIVELELGGVISNQMRIKVVAKDAAMSNNGMNATRPSKLVVPRNRRARYAQR